MPKRRRERDRPNEGPETADNLNKRVLLSYHSGDEFEDEVEAESTGTGHPIAFDAATANYQIEEYPDDEDDVGAMNENALSYEDEHAESPIEEDEQDEENAHGQRQNESSLWTRGGTRRNDTTGQWPALGSTLYQWDDAREDDADYDSAEEEAMAYLKAVRSERQAMPTVLKAPTSHSHEDIYETGIGDHRGYVKDGAYVARASSDPPISDPEKSFIHPQEAFTASLKERLLKQRFQMHLSPGADALAALDDRHPISFPANNNKAYAEWHKLIRMTVPLPAQLRSMYQDTVFGLIELIQKHYLVREKEIIGNVSAWIWSLLARLDDVGIMNNGQVSAIREFGKRAVLVQLSFSDSSAALQLERTAAEEGLGVKASHGKTSAIESLERQPKAHAAASESENKNSSNVDLVNMDPWSRQNTMATLDMIVTIVGEIFGQRDLLNFRQPWSRPAEEITDES